MAFVLVAVVFLFALVFLFFAKFQNQQMTEQAKVLREFRSITMLRVVAGLPELQCSLQGSRGISVCIDKNKLETFNNKLQLRESYSELWSNSNIASIIIEKIYPDEEKYTVYEKKPKPTNTITYSTYIPLCSQSDYQVSCSIAQIKIATVMP